MAYTIVKSDGTVLTTIADGTINTTSTSLGLPGRNYPGYGQTLDTNFVHMLESFADDVPPTNPIKGQLWFNTNNNTLYVCPINYAPSAEAWLALTATASGGTTSFGNVDVNGTLYAGNIEVSNSVSVANLLSTFDITVSNLATIGNTITTNAAIGTLTTQAITTGGQSINGTLTGVWTANGQGTASGVAGTSVLVTGGNLVVKDTNPAVGIRADNYMLLDGSNLFSAGSAYSNANVAAYLPTYIGNVGANTGGINPTVFNGNVLNAGGPASPGSVTGDWTFTSGSKFTVGSANISTLGSNNIINAGNILSSNVYANTGTIGASLLTGTLTTAAQPNITSIGTLSALSVTGNITAGNIQGIFANGTSNVRIPLANGNVNISAAGNANILVVTGTGVNVSGTLNSTGNANVGNIGAENAVFTGVASVIGNVSAGGLKTDNIYYANGTPWDMQQPSGSNRAIQYNLDNNFGGSANFTFDQSTNILTVVGNANVANLNASGVVSATGNVSGGNLNTTGVVAATGNVSGGNISTTGSLSVTGTANITGNVTAANVNANSFFIRSVGSGISAAGTTQGTATVLTKEYNIVTSISAGVTDGVKLPTAVAGMAVVIVNTSTADLKVYPDSAAAINSLSLNASYTQPGKATLQFIATSTTQWYTVGATYA